MAGSTGVSQLQPIQAVVVSLLKLTTMQTVRVELDLTEDEIYYLACIGVNQHKIADSDLPIELIEEEPGLPTLFVKLYRATVPLLNDEQKQWLDRTKKACDTYDKDSVDFMMMADGMSGLIDKSGL